VNNGNDLKYLQKGNENQANKKEGAQKKVNYKVHLFKIL